MDPSCSASAAPAGLTVQVCFPGARAAVLDNLNQQREEGRLCDLSIQVQGQVFRAHRCVLAASSPYFHDQVGRNKSVPCEQINLFRISCLLFT